MPCRLIGYSRGVDQEGAEVGLEVGMADIGDVQIAAESVLVWSASIVRDLQLGLA